MCSHTMIDDAMNREGRERTPPKYRIAMTLDIEILIPPFE